MLEASLNRSVAHIAVAKRSHCRVYLEAFFLQTTSYFLSGFRFRASGLGCRKRKKSRGCNRNLK